MSSDPAVLLLPLPHHVQWGNRRCRVAQGALQTETDDPRIVGFAEEFLRNWAAGEAPRLRIGIQRGATPSEQGYCLRIEPSGIELIGASVAGCFYGLQTLRQMTVAASSAGHASGFDPRKAPSPFLPTCMIQDQPTFALRGVLHDVTRGKVPKLDTLKAIVDRLASWKVNQLQLYIEHAFVFSFDRSICSEEHGLLPTEIEELDRYCRDRFVMLVPAVANLGHMGRILSLPQYRHLAEVEATKEWKEMSWPERARGLTLDCRNPDGFALVERIWREILDAFSSPVVNLCGDEPWDLGEGKNKQHFASGKGPPYVEHLRRVQRLCESRGRSVQFWSDVIRHYPDLLDADLRRAMVLHWGYDDKADYDGTALFRAAGVRCAVCPGTTGWKRIVNSLGLAERNIRDFSAAGVRHGAEGLIVTDWGDHGHFNPLSGSWHGLALGAALGWNSQHPTGTDFDRRLAWEVLGVAEAFPIQVLRLVSGPLERIETWRLMWQPIEKMAQDADLPSLEVCKTSSIAAELLHHWFTQQSQPFLTADVRELDLTCRFVKLFSRRVAWAWALRGSDATRAARRKRKYVSQLEALWPEYASAWLCRNKSGGLRDITRVLLEGTKWDIGPDTWVCPEAASEGLQGQLG